MKTLTKIVMTLLIVALGANTAQARFLQTDPVGYEADINLYAYVDNDPVNLVDPDGKKPESYWDRQYVYPKLSEEQRRQLDQVHYDIGEKAFTGAAIGASIAVPVEGIVIRGGSMLIRGGLELAASSRFARGISQAAEVASKRGFGRIDASGTGGVRFADGKGNQIRIERGKPKSDFASQRGPYVKETSGGKVRDVNGNEITPTKEFPKPKDNPAAHIPLKDWLRNNQ